jgi:hypothetical protein
MIVSKKFLLPALLTAIPVLFIATGCGTWNRSVTVPITGQTSTNTPLVTATLTATLTITPTGVTTKTPTATPTMTQTSLTTYTPTGTPTPTGTSTITPTGTMTQTATTSATATQTNVCSNPTSESPITSVNYTLLAESGITDTGSHSCLVTGNVGNPSGAPPQMGLLCTELTGTIYIGDAGDVAPCVSPNYNPLLIGTDTTAMTTAYTTANGQAPCTTDLGAGTLSGVTITSGVYKWTTSLDITTDIYLDAQGNSSAVWVLQIADTLTLASSVTIHLINGALAENVFWTVAGTSGATIGTYANFAGVLMSYAGIAVQTGATVNGRLFSQSAITLDANTITP